MCEAVQNGRTDIIKLLLARTNIDPNIKSRYQETPLHLAVKARNIDVIKLLLAHTDINLRHLDIRIGALMCK